jgi:glycogen debranching enzyme
MSRRDRRVRRRLERLAATAAASRKRLEADVHIVGRDLRLYRAGLREGRDWFGLFGRDLLITALLLGEREFARDALRFVSATLGSRFDPRTGEEPGRGLHEFNDVEMRGLSTRYNASEVSLLFLVVAAEHLAEAEDDGLVREISGGLTRAADYLLRHCKDGLFREDPAACGATRYALRATYWKDSRLPGREDPHYPVTYTLVQAQAVAAFRAAARLAEHLPEAPASRTALIAEADRAAERFADLWDPSFDHPVIALDREGPIRGVSSDALHMLFYLDPEDLDRKQLAAVARGANALATPFGYRTYAERQEDYDPHAYHLGAIWPFEQAIIAHAAARHGLPSAREVALRIVGGLETLGFHELFYWDGEGDLEGGTAVEGQGCDLQLWTLAVPAALLSLVERSERDVRS